MGVGQRQKQVREYRGQIPSPGRPTVAWREDRVRFWASIADGVKTEDAAVEAGVSSPVAFRWFRHAGGVNPGLAATVSGRYLSSAERRARRPKVAKLVIDDRLRRYVQDRLSGVVQGADGGVVGPAGPAWKGRNKPHRGDRAWVQGWSPAQIANRLPVDFPDDQAMRISHEAIYQALYVQGRGALQRELVACLRTGRALRVPQARARQKAWAHVTPEVLLSERPAEVADRAVPGHWEGDLIIGLQRSAIGTLVERTTGGLQWTTNQT